MSSYTDEQKTKCLENARQRIAVISGVGRSHLACAEEFALGYVQALTDVGALSFDQRDELYALAAEAVEQRKRRLKANTGQKKPPGQPAWRSKFLV